MLKIHRSEAVKYHHEGTVDVWGFPVHAGIKDGKIHIWYLIDEEAPLSFPMKMSYVQTGDEFEGVHYFTVVFDDGYVAHIIWGNKND